MNLKISAYNILNASPMNIKACTLCPILPICIGGCSQHIIESKSKDECPLNMNLIQKIDYAYKIFCEKIQ